jgi:hypothetical protein
MASSTPGTVTKIYRLETQGLDSVLSDLGTVGKAFDAVSKSKQKYADVMEKVRTKQGEESQAFQNAKRNYDDASRSMENLSTKQKSLTSDKDALIRMQKLESDGTAKAVSQYTQLVNSYKEAKTRAEELAAEYGVNDERAKVAAVSAAAYKQELKEINDLLKNPRPASDNVPFTSNMAELEAEALAAQKTGVAVNELDIAEAEAANSATAMGAATRTTTKAVDDHAEAVQRMVLPYEQYTGTLEANIRQNLQYKQRLAEISVALKKEGADTVALTKEQDNLKKASAELTQTISAQTKFIQAADGSYDQLNARLGIARNLMRGLSEQEKSSVFGKQLSGEIQILDTQLKAQDAKMGNYARSVGNYGNAFQKAFGFIRTLAQILPGIGIAGIFGFIIDGLTGIISKLFGAEDATNKVKESALVYRDVMKEIGTETIKNTAGDVTRLGLLRDILTDTTKSQQARTAALKEYNSIADSTNKIDESQLNNIGLINDKISTQIALIEKRGLARAAESVIAQKSETLLKAQLDAEESIRAQDANAARLTSGIRRVLPAPPASFKVGDKIRVMNASTGLLEEVTVTADNLQKLKASQQQALKEMDEVQKASEIRQRVALVPAVQNAKNELDTATSAFRNLVADSFAGDTTGGGKEAAGSKLSGGMQDALKEIEAIRLRMLAVENTAVNELAKDHKLTFDEEKAHLLALEKINVDALNKKIALLNAQKSLNAEEKATLAKFAEERSSIELDTSKKLQDIEKKRFADQDSDLKIAMDQRISAANEAAQTIQLDETLSNEERAQARLDADNQILAAETEYYQALLKLNADYNTDAVAQIEKQLAATRGILAKDQRDVIIKRIADIKDEGDKEITERKIMFDNTRAAILANEKLTDEDRKRRLDDLTKAEEIDLLRVQLDVLNRQLAEKKKLYDQGLISEKEYLDALEAARAKANELSEKGFNQGVVEKAKKTFSDLKSAIQVGLRDIFNIRSGSKNDEALGNILAQSYDLAKSALNDYYDAERTRIQDSLDLQLQRLDIEKEQRLSFAQSAAERDSIEKQYAAKQKAAQAKAGEELKRTKKAEARIALATELANIWASVYQLGPIAGPIAGVVLSGLALGRFALRIGEINREKFEQGGPVPTKGGEFGGKSHSDGGTPFFFQGQGFEAEAKELAIIRTKNAPSKAVYNLSGTQRQIASALNRIGGGIDFASGARVSRMFDYGGSLGTSLSAPVYTPSLSSGSAIADNRQFIEEMRGLRADMASLAAEQSSRIDRLQVQVVSKEVTRAQNRDIKKSSIGTL